MLVESKYLTREEFCKITHTDPSSRLFERLGSNPILMRLPYHTERKDQEIWYHASDRNDYWGNFAVREDIHEVWVDSKTIAEDFGLEKRNYGFWFLWAKY